MRFDVLWVDILPGRQNDHVFLPSDDVKVALWIKPAKIARAKPPVFGKGVVVGLRVTIITGHDDWPANQHFTNPFSVWLVNLYFDAVERRTYRPDLIVLKAGNGRGASRLRQAIPLKDRKPQRVIVAGDAL